MSLSVLPLTVTDGREESKERNIRLWNNISNHEDKENLYKHHACRRLVGLCDSHAGTGTCLRFGQGERGFPLCRQGRLDGRSVCRGHDRPHEEELFHLQSGQHAGLCGRLQRSTVEHGRGAGRRRRCAPRCQQRAAHGDRADHIPQVGQCRGALWQPCSQGGRTHHHQAQPRGRPSGERAGQCHALHSEALSEISGCSPVHDALQ